MKTETGTDIKRAADILRNGGLVAIPTETVYGLAADALNPEAVLRIFRVKKRPDFDPLIVHAASAQQAFQWAAEISEKALRLAEAFWPGPLTLVLPKKAQIPFEVTSGLNTVGLRVPDHPLTLALLREINRPLAAPSANPFGYISPTEAEHVNQNLGGEVDYVLDGGPCSRGLESTIIGFEENEPVLYRLGSLPVEEIERIAGPVHRKLNLSSDPQAPGQLASHYSPEKKIVLWDNNNPVPKGSFCLITFGNSLSFLRESAYQILSLSEEGNLPEAARKLYGLLRKADRLPCDYIITSLLPAGPLSDAINDRLKRAAHITNNETHE